MRFQADRAGSMFVLLIWMLARGGVLRNFEWIGRNSVLSSLTFKELRGIHHRISVMHASSYLMVSEKREGSEGLSQEGSEGLSQDKYSWESSAYK